MTRKTSKSSKPGWTNLEKHPFRVLLTFAVLIGGAVYGIVHYFDSERLEATRHDYEVKLADSQSKLASINRGLAGGDYINVARLVVHRGERDRVPAQSKFYADDSFYAPAVQGWTYKKTTDTEFFTSIFGEEGKKQINELTGLAPVHVWTRGPLVPLGNHDVSQNFAPCIYLQRLPIDDLTVQLNLEATKNSQSTTLFQGDVIGAMLAQTFANVFKTLTFTSETQASLLNINKVSNVLYCQFLLTLRNVTINSQKRDSYFITLEMIVISTKDSVYTVCDLIPSEEPMLRGPIPAEVTEWINGFTVFSD